MANDLQKRVEILYQAIDDGASTTAESLAKNLGEVDKAAAKSSKSTDVVSTSMKNLAAAIASVVSVGKALAFAKESIGLFQEQDQANRLVAASFGASAAGVQEYARALEGSAKISDATTLSYAGMLKNMGLTEEQIKSTITASADLVAGSGGLISMETAVKNLAKTYGGMAGELGESVPTLRNLTKEQLQAGLGVELVAQQYRGLARELAQTDTGKIRGLSNEITNLKEEIGQQLIPAQVSWLETQKSLISLAVDLTPVLKTVAGGVSLVAESIQSISDNKVAVGLGALAVGLYGMNAALATSTLSWASFNAVVAANPIGLATVAVGSLIVAINKLTGDFDKVLEKQDQFLNGDTQKIQETITLLKQLSEINRNASTITKEQFEEGKRLEKQLEAISGQNVKYSSTTREAYLESKTFLGIGNEVATTVRNLENSISAKNIVQEKAKKADEAAAKALTAEANAVTKAIALAKAREEAEKQRIADKQKAGELSKQIDYENLLATKSVRDQEILGVLNSTNERREVLLKSYSAESEQVVALEQNKIDKIAALRAKFAEEDTKAREDKAKRDADAAKEAEEKATKEAEDATTRERERYGLITDLAMSAAASITSIMDAVTNKREANLSRETKMQIDAVKKSTLSEDEKAKKIAAIENRAAEERYKIATAEWRNNLIMSVANTALSVAKTLASVPYPASIPLAIAAGATGLVQTGIIASNKPQRMAEGGVLSGGSTVNDSVPFQGNAGERIINKQRTRKLDKAIDSGAIGGASNTFNVTVPIEIPPTATVETANSLRDVADFIVDKTVRALELAAEQGKIDKTRFAGVFA